MIMRLAAAAIALMLGAAPAMAQDSPAAKGLDADAKAALGKLIEGAKQEGSLAYADTILQPSTNTILAKAFRDYYGLPASFQVNYTLLQSGALVTRIEQEISADKVRFDVASVGSPTWVIEKHKAGQLLEYRSPQYAAFKAAFETGLGIDGVFAFNGGYAQIPIWNTEILDFKGKSYKEAVAAAVPGRFSVGDVANSESHLTTYAGLRQVFDVPFFKSMAQKKPAFLSRSEQSAQRIVTGQDVIAFGGNPSRVLQNNQKGAKLKILYPEEGFVLLPQATFILKAAPHPNAAKLWLDFVLSEAGQDILARNEALMSGRAGFKSPVPDVAPNFEQLKIIKVDWTAMTADQLRKYRDEWVSIFNP